MLFPNLAFSASEALVSVHDAARLNALYESDLLDTPPEAAFDRISRLAARALGTPSAALILIDRDRQYVKSLFGMEFDIPYGQCLQTPLSHSVCQYVVETDAPFAFDDALKDGFFATHQAVMEIGIVAYLGVPIRWEDPKGKRRALGALCVWDTIPRVWQPEDVTLLQEFAALVESEFRLRAAAQKSRKQNQALSDALVAQALSEAKFQGFTNASPLGIFVLDTKGDCIYANPKVRQTTGASSEEELLGRAFTAAIHPSDRERVMRRWDEAVVLRRELHSVHRMARSDRMGRDIWVSTKTAPLYGEVVDGNGGEFLGWVGTCDDISERKAAEDALTETFRFVHQITETVPLIMTVTDLRQQENVYANHGFSSVLGYRAEALQNTAKLPLLHEANTSEGVPEADRAFIYSKMHPDDRAGYDAHIRQVLQQAAGETPLAHQYRLQHARGQWRWFRSRDAVFERDRVTGEPTHLLSIAEDVTSAKNHEDKLLALTEQLKRSNASLQEFASVASHDLQEPLRKVQAFGDRLRSKYGDILEGDGAEYLDRMLAASARMQALIDDLLRYSRVSSKAQEFRVVDLNEIARDVVGDLEARIQQTGGRITLRPLPSLESDPMQMRQLLQNLLSNALKFHKPDAAPEINVSAEIVAEETASVCRISIQDNGIGFESQYAERVFNVFERLHSRGHYEGTGMGLAICRKIVQRHGGTIAAHSLPEKGTLFLVTLPVTHRTELTSGQETLPAASAYPSAETPFLMETKGKYSV